LAIALAECCFGATEIGASIELESDLGPELLLFHEAPSRVLVSASSPERILALAEENGVEVLNIGVTLKSRVTVRNRGQLLINSRVNELKQIWANSLEDLLHNPVLV
jgi:phosphoribosylformylglycinamidine (FGAM) synthase-like enzyme